ncbi:MAG: TIGR00270 family protein [Methanomassiliicoccales archaeon]|nr:MAG: TIGR00270 family protein [Methanomassiliicoccales archaeon]
MICEMCGQEAPRLWKITIEGTNLSVCQKCEKFGRNKNIPKGKEMSASSDTISERLQRREKRLRTKDVFEERQDELALDYPKRISRARVSMGMSQDDLAKKINEKKSVVAKLENGDMVPDEKLVKKLEKALEISLKEKLGPVAPPKRSEAGKGMTLGDFIKVERK